MKEYNYFQALYMSFYSRSLYRDIVKNWGAGVIVYLLILLSICWAAMMFKYQPIINGVFREFISKIGPQIPTMTIKKGILTTPENRPYLIKDPEKGATIGIIDTSGQYINMENVPKDTSFLVTQDTTYYLDNHKTLKVNKISKTLSLDINPEKIQQTVIKWVGWLWVLLLPVLIIMSLIYRLVQALFYALIGKVFAAMSKVPLTYAEVLKLSMVAITPAIVFATVLDWFNITFPLEGLVCFLIAMIYLVFAIGSNNTALPENNAVIG